MRSAIVNTATSANALHQIVYLVRKPVTSGRRAIPEWPACRQPLTSVNPDLEVVGKVYLGRLDSRCSLALPLHESVNPQSRFTFVRSRRVESNCVANPDSGLKHEFEKQTERKWSARVPMTSALQLFGSSQDEIDFRIRIRILLLMGSAIRPHLFREGELRPATTISFTEEASNLGGHLRLASRSHTVWQTFNFEVFEQIDAQFAHEVNAARRAVSSQPIELEPIGRRSFFAEVLFARCAEAIDAIIEARTVDLLVLAVLQKRLPLGLCHCNDVRPRALTGYVGRFGIPVDPQRAIAIHVLAFCSRRELKLVNGASFRVAAIEG